MSELEAELIFNGRADADAAEIALCDAGFTVEQRPDWDDSCGGGCAWLCVTTIADDVHVFGARVRAIIEPHGGWIWVAGPDWVCAQYNETLELPRDVQ